MKAREKEYLKIVNQKLDEIMTYEECAHTKLHESMRYSIMAGGKRIRPLLSAACCELLKEDFKLYLPFACALEIIHTYSLIHDDLPAMDDDDFRRGIPTNHKKYGEAMAILAGDALLNLAAIILSGEVCKAKNTNSAAMTMKYILEASGPEGMIAGQVIDMAQDLGNKSFKDIKAMHSLKTGELIKASLCAPAILFHKSNVLMELEEISRSVGIAFQIKDDILDVEGDFKSMGKMTGRDEIQKKKTYVTVYGLDRSREMLAGETQKAYEKVRQLFGNDTFLEYLIHGIANRDK